MTTHPKGPAERRYHKMAVGRWGDREWRELSQDAQFLYLRLATGPESLPVPGVALVKKHGLALDALSWEMSRFEASFAQLVAGGLAEADWQAGVVYLPRELSEPFADPQSIPSVTCWRRALANAPGCDLISRIRGAVSARLEAMVQKGKSPTYLRAFLEARNDWLEEEKGEKVPPSVPPKIQYQSPKQEILPGIAQRPSPAGEDLPDMTDELAEFMIELPARSCAGKRRTPPALPRSAFDRRQGALALVALPTPEFCAAAVKRNAGALFAHGPLIPGDTELGGVLHPRYRSEWTRVLQDYFGPLNMNGEQVRAALEHLGKYMAGRGETITLDALTRFSGERLHHYMQAAMAWDGRRRAQQPQPPAQGAQVVAVPTGMACREVPPGHGITKEGVLYRMPQWEIARAAREAVA